MNSSNTKLDSRVSSLETAVESLSGEIRGYQQSNASELHSLHSGIESLREQITNSQRTQWSPILGGVGMVITIIGLFLSGYGSNQARIEGTLTKLTESFVRHTQSDGHPAMNQRVEALDKSVAHLDDVLQREMRMLDSAMDKDIESLDIRLQREMELLDRNIITRVEAVESRANRSESWQETHDQRVRGTNASQDERIRSLERVVFKTDTQTN